MTGDFCVHKINIIVRNSNSQIYKYEDKKILLCVGAGLWNEFLWFIFFIIFCDWFLCRKPKTTWNVSILASPDTHFVWQNATGQGKMPLKPLKYILSVRKIPRNAKVMWQCFTLMWHFRKSDVTMHHIDVTFLTPYLKVMWQCFTLMWQFRRSDVTMHHFDVTFFTSYLKVMWQCFTLIWHFRKSDVTMHHFDVTILDAINPIICSYFL